LGARKGPPCGSGESAVSPPPTERGHPRSGGRRLVERITDEIIRSGDYRTAAAFDVYEINANLAVCGHANVSKDSDRGRTRRRDAEARAQRSCVSPLQPASTGRVHRNRRLLERGGIAMTFAARLEYARANWRKEDGQTMAEYGVVLAVITLGIVATLVLLSGGIQGALNSVISKL
jgi:Flp pilus assembly pilin Flp